jgi:hypothetical protein
VSGVVPHEAGTEFCYTVLQAMRDLPEMLEDDELFESAKVKVCSLTEYYIYVGVFFSSYYRFSDTLFYLVPYVVPCFSHSRSQLLGED